MTAVEHAVIVAGGLGSRMLPASAYTAKETMPLVDVPSMIHLILEAKHAGIKHIHFILSPDKDISSILNEKSKYSTLRNDIDSMLFESLTDVQYHIHIQHEALGLGHALLQSLTAINGPFAVLLGDNILLDSYEKLENYQPSNATKNLIHQFNLNQSAVAGIYTVPDEELSKYGVVSLSGDKIVSIIEKPKIEDAPSNYVLCGRYIFTEDAKNLLENTFSVEQFGEMQSIELQKYWMARNLLSFVDLSKFSWYDSGNPLSWIKSQVDYALRRADLAPTMREWLTSRLN